MFEIEQEDGEKYSREEIIGNLVDWIDADDHRIVYDPFAISLPKVPRMRMDIIETCPAISDIAVRTPLR